MTNLISIILLFGISTSTFSQNKLNFGLEVFPGFSKEYENSFSLTSNQSHYKMCLGLQVYSSINFKPNFFFSFGIGYQNTGGRTKKLFSNPKAKNKTYYAYNHQNILLPLMLKYKLSKKIYMLSGVNTNFNIKNTTKIKTNNTIGRSKNTYDKNTIIDYRKFNFSGQVGLGCTLYKTNYYNPNSYQLYVEIKYDIALTSISTNTKIHPIVWGVVFGIKH